MFTLMHQVSDIYRDRLVEYADTQEAVEVKSYALFSLSRAHIDVS